MLALLLESAAIPVVSIHAMPMMPSTSTRRGRLIFWILLVLLLIAGVWYYFLGPGAHGPILPPISRR